MSNFNRTGQNRQGGSYQGGNQPAKEDAAMVLPPNFVDKAMEAMDKLKNSKLTTSKIRRILSMVNDLRSSLLLNTEDKLTEAEKDAIQYLRMRIAYESGREESVKQLVTESHMIGYLKDIGDDKRKLEQFITYVEALVAYHRFFGGKE